MGKSINENEQLLKLIGKRIRDLRRQQGYTSQETFAYDNGYTLSHYSRMERGQDIRLSSLIKLCKCFQIDLKTFFSGLD
jgi:transcriptional regulator with XRE-family HTH domain